MGDREDRDGGRKVRDRGREAEDLISGDYMLGIGDRSWVTEHGNWERAGLGLTHWLLALAIGRPRINFETEHCPYS